MSVVYTFPGVVLCGHCGRPLRQDGYASGVPPKAVMYCTASDCVNEHVQFVLTASALQVEKRNAP
jgi:hypothetical protein